MPQTIKNTRGETLFTGNDNCFIATLERAIAEQIDLSGAIFTNADLYNTCLAYSTLTDTNFIDTNFGGTDITGATLCRTKFSGTSCFDLDFINAADIIDCIYIQSDQTMQRFSTTPIVIKGLRKPMIFFDRPAAQTPIFLALNTHNIDNYSITVE